MNFPPNLSSGFKYCVNKASTWSDVATPATIGKNDVGASASTNFPFTSQLAKTVRLQSQSHSCIIFLCCCVRSGRIINSLKRPSKSAIAVRTCPSSAKSEFSPTSAAALVHFRGRIRLHHAPPYYPWQVHSGNSLVHFVKSISWPSACSISDKQF